MNGKAFQLYVEQMPVPTLKPGDVAIMDNFSGHKAEAARYPNRDHRRNPPLPVPLQP